MTAADRLRRTPGVARLLAVALVDRTGSGLFVPISVGGGLLAAVSGGATPMALEHYQTAFQPLLYGVGLAIVLTVILRETGPGITQPARDVARAS